MGLLFLGWTIFRIDFNSHQSASDSLYFILLGLIIFLISYLPRIYAIKNQNRIIRMEMRQRYFQLTGKAFYEKENKLSPSQIIALRFAGDDELLALIDKTIQENTTPKEIKKSVSNWQADHHRV
ncbi:hypothetical protein SAMN06265367_10149 [Algoriphagus winogradskyi]|uniref:Uncharacterized protein n=2 Tax=Algoriphagus winogradskyi TaxID=237017 RepID=A0ABY1N6N4_9BACT|nr:hypothetical protein SAMN06265367_10149 [Algoriphagus winogradskyi]